MRKYILILAGLSAGLLSSCLDDDYADQSNIDQDRIQAYIGENDLDLEYDANSGIYYRISDEGDPDRKPSTDSTLVTVNLEGRLLNNEVFIKGDSLQLDLEKQPIGLLLGVSSIGEGGEIFLIVPSLLGYGSASITTDTPYQVTIPPYSILMYNAELLKVSANKP